MVIHLEPDILECKVKWDLGKIIRNKATRGHGIPAELFHILKGDDVKMLHSICQQIWKHQQEKIWKRSVFILIPQNGNVHILAFHILARLCSKSFKLGLISK